VLTVTADDGSEVKAYDEGAGPPILIVHPGLDDGRSYKRVASRLAGRFRVVRVLRPLYRLDRPGGCSIGYEVDHVLAVAKKLPQPMLLFGHSSGAIIALEALVASPDLFAGAVIYEPPLVVGPPLGGDAATRAQAALKAGKPSQAMTIFARDVVGVPAAMARLSSLFIAAIPRYRGLIPRQLDDLDAIDALGYRLDAYAGLELPMVLIAGDRSPAHLRERLDALGRAVPHAERVVLHGRGHDANVRAPGDLARIIERQADKVLS